MNDMVTVKLEELGQAVMADPRRIVWMAAKSAHDNDADLQALIACFGETREALMTADVGATEPEKISEMSETLSKYYDEITAHPLMVGLMKAQEDLNTLTAQLNSRIQFFVTGEEPIGCTPGGCAGCKGCS